MSTYLPVWLFTHRYADVCVRDTQDAQNPSGQNPSDSIETEK